MFEPHGKVQASFSVSSDYFDIKAFTKELEITPTKAWVKGEEIPNKTIKRRQSCWIIETEVEHSWHIQEQFEQIYSLLENKVALLLALKDKYKLSYQFGFYVCIEDGDVPAISLDEPAIAFIAQLGANLDVDTYVF